MTQALVPRSIATLSGARFVDGMLTLLPPVLVITGGLAAYQAAPTVMGWLKPPAKIVAPLQALPIPAPPVPAATPAPVPKVEPPKVAAQRAPEPIKTPAPVVTADVPVEPVGPAVVGAAAGAAAVVAGAVASRPTRIVRPVLPRRMSMPTRVFVPRAVVPRMFAPRLPFGPRGLSGFMGVFGGGRRFGW